MGAARSPYAEREGPSSARASALRVSARTAASPLLCYRLRAFTVGGNIETAAACLTGAYLHASRRHQRLSTLQTQRIVSAAGSGAKGQCLVSEQLSFDILTMLSRCVTQRHLGRHVLSTSYPSQCFTKLSRLPVSPFLAELFPMPFAARSQMQFGAFLRTVEAPTPPLLGSGVARLLGRLQPGSPLRPVLGEAVWAYVLASVCSNGVAVVETRLSCATVIHMWLVYT